MSDVVTVAPCPACGAEMPPDLLACPGCHRLVHGPRLSKLAEQAATAERAGDNTAALAYWREALELLPPNTNQFAAVQSQVRQLSQRINETPATVPKHKSALGKIGAGVGVVLLFAVTKGKLLLIGLTKASTFLSMFAFFGAYWAAWGWQFAAGLVVSIYIHEMGHMDALRRYGFKTTVPMFIPGVGAMIRMRQHPTSPAEDARIGLAGPLWGMAAALASYLVYLGTHVPIWAAIAHFGAIINLFNLIPIGSLDGGRGFHALSRTQAYLITAALAVAWYCTGEGMVLLIALVALVRATVKRKEEAPDQSVFALFLFLIASLTALSCVRGA